MYDFVVGWRWGEGDLGYIKGWFRGKEQMKWFDLGDQLFSNFAFVWIDEIKVRLRVPNF